MSSLETRLARLEETLRPMIPVKLFMCDGITPEQAIRAAGHDPADPNFCFLCVVIVDPKPSKGAYRHA